MALELPRPQIEDVREGFASWVTDFERCVNPYTVIQHMHINILDTFFPFRLYYRHSPDRLRVCTLPIHSLLHIADDIEAMGPVWCYWAFPMERFCGALGRANLNPHFPFVSMDRRVLEVAQLAQIKYMYNLFDSLDLSDGKHAIATSTRYPEYPHSVFVRPRRIITVNGPLAKQLGAYIGDMYDINPKDVERRIKGRGFNAWGKMQKILGHDGLDIITGHSLMPDTETLRRDATFVKVRFLLFGISLGQQITQK
jgi:hypothetical protein